MIVGRYNLAEILPQYARFFYYENQVLWYIVSVPGECEECGCPEKYSFSFPVPVQNKPSVQNKPQVFKARMKASELSEWIKSHLEYLKEREGAVNAKEGAG
jgi:hypothetical protein